MPRPKQLHPTPQRSRTDEPVVPARPAGATVATVAPSRHLVVVLAVALAAGALTVVTPLVDVVAPSIAVAAPGDPLAADLDAWAFCGVHPDDPTAEQAARSMATAAGIDATFGPCNVPTPDYTPVDPANRYVSPALYRELVDINAAAGMRTLVYDARIWSADADERDEALDFWAPVFDHIEAWDLGDEFDPDSSQWQVLIERWNRVRTEITPVSGIAPFANHLYWAVDEALDDLPGSEELLSFTWYADDQGASVARSIDDEVARVMCGVNAFDHLGYVPDPDTIRSHMHALRGAGCDAFLVFGGQRVYATDLFGGDSLVDVEGMPTDWAPAVLEGSGRSSFTGVGPARLLETRAALTTVDGLQNAVGRRGDGAVSGVDVAGRADVPDDAVAVSLSITAVDPSRPGFVTVWPCGRPQPVVSQLTHARATISSTVVVEPGADGRVCVFNMVETDLVIDVDGYLPAGAAFAGGDPARLLETRVGDEAAGEVLTTVDGRDNGIGPREGGSVTELQVAGRAGVPTDVRSVVLSLTVTGARAPGFATVYPCGGTIPASSNVNYTAGATVTNTVVTPVSASGRVCVYTMATVDMVVDIGGYLPSLAPISTTAPVRLLDSRSGADITTVDGRHLAFGPVRADVVTEVSVAGRAGFPDDVGAVILAVTVTEPVRSGFVSVYACGSPRPLAAHVNFAARQTVSNLVFAEVGDDGSVCVYSMAGIQLVVDVLGALP